MTLKHAFLGVMATSLLAFACDVDRSSKADPAGYYFTGVVYDGLTGKPVTDYTITLDQANLAEPAQGVVNAETGAYEIGPVKPGSDFVISINGGDAYRPFFAAEPLENNLPNTDNEQTTQYFEAYLFPTELESPAVTLEMYGAYANTTRPSGQVRFAPTADELTGSSALNLVNATQAAVGDQIWFNDADLKSPSVILPLTAGVVDVAAGALVYGVTYTATVYSVDGHAYQDFGFTAGLTGHQTILLQSLAADPLKLIGDSLDTGDWSQTGTVTFTFNEPIEFSPTTPENVAAELIDDNITIDGADTAVDDDTIGNVLIGDGVPTEATDSPNKLERGTSIVIDGNTLTLSWPGYNKAASFEPDMFDLDDLRSVTYDLAGISIRRVGATDGEKASLTSLVGDTVTVDLQAPAAL